MNTRIVILNADRTSKLNSNFFVRPLYIWKIHEKVSIGKYTTYYNNIEQKDMI